jgi:hypothetical protein
MKLSTRFGIAIAVLALAGGWLLWREAAAGKSLLAAGTGKSGFELGATRTSTHMNSSTSSSRSDFATFSARRLLFLRDDTHPLGREVSDLLVKQLRATCPDIGEIQVAGPGQELKLGERAPDLFLQLRLGEADARGLVSQTVKVTMHAGLGTTPWHSSHHTIDSTTPPVLTFNWNGTVESETAFQGIRSDRYAPAAQAIAHEFAQGISNVVVKAAKENPELPELPASFYGPYEPAPELAFLRETGGRMVFSGYGLLTRNETFWTFNGSTNPVEVLRRIITELEAVGWKAGDQALTNTRDHYARLSRNGTTLELFREDRNLGTLVEEPPGPVTLVAHYRRPFTDTERTTALDELFRETRPVEDLVPFRNMLSNKQREELYRRLEAEPPLNATILVDLAEQALRQRNTNQARILLVRAKVASSLQADSDASSRIDDTAKKISKDTTSLLRITPEICRGMGLVELTNAPMETLAVKPVDQPVGLFAEGKRGVSLFAASTRVRRGGALDWALVHAEENSRSSTHGSISPPTSTKWVHTATFDGWTLDVAAELTADKKQVRYRITTRR